MRVLAAWLEATRLAGVAGGWSGPGSRGVVGSWLAEQLKEGEALDVFDSPHLLAAAPDIIYV